jgi:hypothetical protein
MIHFLFLTYWLEQVGDALFVAGGNDVVVYDLSKVRPDTPSKDPPVQVGRCGGACAKILGGSASRANAHGMAYRFDVSEQMHNLVLTAAYANRVGIVSSVTSFSRLLRSALPCVDWIYHTLCTDL